MLSLVITFLISSTPNVLIFSDVTTLISGCSRMSLELNNKLDEKAFAWSIKYREEPEIKRYEWKGFDDSFDNFELSSINI